MRPFIAATLALIATPALADAVTYRGELNGMPIVLELSEAAESASGNLVGRYFYVDQGIDIPLRATEATSGSIALVEEAPCDETDCEIDQSGLIRERTPSAIWALTVEDSGTRLAGSWTPPGKTALTLKLERVGSRPFVPYDPPSPADLAEFSLLLGSEGPLTQQTSPYDFLKVATPVTHSEPTRWGDVEFDYVTDPRTLFRYPRLLRAGASDIATVNAYLEQRDWGMRLAALNCRAQIYPSMTLGGSVPPDAGSLGGFDEEMIEVQYLSPQLLTFSEGGSLFCGSAYPENHFHVFNIDVTTGKPIDLSRLFEGWVARDFASGELIDLETARNDPTNYGWGADKELSAFVAAKAPTLGEAEFDEECEYPGIIAEHLTISFKMPDHVVFGLDGLAHVVQACAQDLYEAPIGELKDLLLPEASTYFPNALD